MRKPKPKTKVKAASAVAWARADNSVGKSFIADFAQSNTPAEIAARLFNNKHPRPLEYFLELWRADRFVMPTINVLDVVRQYDRMLIQRPRAVNE
jgi:hypothetical protein